MVRLLSEEEKRAIQVNYPHDTYFLCNVSDVQERRVADWVQNVSLYFPGRGGKEEYTAFSPTHLGVSRPPKDDTHYIILKSEILKETLRRQLKEGDSE